MAARFRASLNGRFIASVAAITISELSGLDYKVAPSTVWQILKDAGIGPAPTRSGYTGRAFLTGQAKTILAVGFFHVDTVFLRRLFNSVQFATDPVAALKHMSHVTRPGGLISFLVWGPPDKCQSGVIFAELGPMTPPAPPAAPSSVAWSEDGQLEALAARAGLTALTVAFVPNPLIYPDLATAVRTQLSSGPQRHRALRPSRRPRRAHPGVRRQPHARRDLPAGEHLPLPRRPGLTTAPAQPRRHLSGPMRQGRTGLGFQRCNSWDKTDR